MRISLRICVWVVAVCASGNVLKAQTQTWVVRDIMTWEPLAGAEVKMVSSISDTLLIATTDSLGEFSLITEAAPTDNLLITQIGYLPTWVDWSGTKRPKETIFLEPLVFETDEVILSASKFASDASEVPYQVTVIRQKLVETDNPSTSAAMLEQAGIFVQRSQAGGGSPVLRGFEANRVLLVVDGVRMNNAIYRSGHLQNVLTIDPDLLERTEVLFGPSSVMYGSDALGGVLHFYSKTPTLSESDHLRIKMNGYVRSGSATEERSIHQDVTIGGRKWAAISSLSWRNFGDLRIGARRSQAYPGWGIRDSLVRRIDGRDQVIANEDPNVMNPSGYGQLDLYQKWYFIPNESTSHTFNWQFSSSGNIPRFDRLTQTREGRLRFATWYYGPQERLLVSYRFQHESAGGIYDNLSVVAAWQNIEESRHSRSFGEDWLNHREEQVSVFSLNADARKKIGDSQVLTYGIETFSNLVQSSAFAENITNLETRALDTRYPDGGTTVWSSGAYLNHQWTPHPDLSLTEGIRISTYLLESRFVDKRFFPFPESQIDQRAVALSGTIGLVWSGWQGYKFSTAFNTGFRAPNLDDVAKVFDSQPGNVVVPNPTLRPERTYNLELSLEKEISSGIRSGITVWGTWYDNAIVVRDFAVDGQDSILYDGVLSNVQANVNAKEAWMFGISHVVQGNWGRVNMRHSLTYTYGQDVSSDVPLDHIPPLYGQGEVGYRVGKLEAGGRLSWQGWKRMDRFSPRDLNNAEFATADGWPAWMRIDVLATYRLIERIHLQAGVDNIFDQHYRSFSSRISAPGRNVWVSLRWNY